MQPTSVEDDDNERFFWFDSDMTTDSCEEAMATLLIQDQYRTTFAADAAADDDDDDGGGGGGEDSPPSIGAVCRLEPNDIIVERGARANGHPGNVEYNRRLRELTRDERSLLVQDVFDNFVKEGRRFLTRRKDRCVNCRDNKKKNWTGEALPCSCKWEKVDDTKAKKKIRMKLHDLKRSRKDDDASPEGFNRNTDGDDTSRCGRSMDGLDIEQVDSFARQLRRLPGDDKTDCTGDNKLNDADWKSLPTLDWSNDSDAGSDDWSFSSGLRTEPKPNTHPPPDDEGINRTGKDHRFVVDGTGTDNSTLDRLAMVQADGVTQGSNCSDNGGETDQIVDDASRFGDLTVSDFSSQSGSNLCPGGKELVDGVLDRRPASQLDSSGSRTTQSSSRLTVRSEHILRLRGGGQVTLGTVDEEKAAIFGIEISF